MGLDPNTVAEYLDNTLPAERVPDFERVCLESDAHLAEVAASHQILTLVLGEPADVHPESRRRMYGLAARQAGETSEVIEVDGAHARVDSGAKKRARKRPHVPDYLRDSTGGGRRWWWAAAAVMLLIVGGVVVLAVGPNRIRTLIADAPQPAADSNENNNANDASAHPAQPGESQSTDTGPETGTENGQTSDAAPSGNPGTTPVIPNVDESPDDVNAADAPVAPLPLDDEPVVAGDAPKPDEPEQDPATDTVPADSASDSEAQQPVTQPLGIGRFFSEKQVTLGSPLDSNQWRRLQARELLFPGTRLLSLPTYRPSLDFSVGVRMELLGNSMVELLAPDENGVPGIRVVYGRMVLMTMAKPGTQFRLDLGGTEGLATFEDAESALAVDVRSIRTDGADPEKDPGAMAVDMFATHGVIQWQESNVEDQRLVRAPARLSLSADNSTEPETVAELPQWISAAELSYREKLANVFVQENLSDERPVSLSLRELAESRRDEVRSLAAHSLSLIGEFGPFVSVLNDSSHKSAWRYQIESLREAMARSPETASQIREAFQRQRGADDGAQLYRMLWGYSDQQVAEGAVAQMLDRLNHDDLDFRVLSIWNLRKISGLNLPYYADQTAEKRQRSIQRWREKLGSSTPRAANGMP